MSAAKRTVTFIPERTHKPAKGRLRLRQTRLRPYTFELASDVVKVQEQTDHISTPNAIDDLDVRDVNRSETNQSITTRRTRLSDVLASGSLSSLNTRTLLSKTNSLLYNTTLKHIHQPSEIIIDGGDGLSSSIITNLEESSTIMKKLRLEFSSSIHKKKHGKSPVLDVSHVDASQSSLLECESPSNSGITKAKTLEVGHPLIIQVWKGKSRKRKSRVPCDLDVVLDMIKQVIDNMSVEASSNIEEDRICQSFLASVEDSITSEIDNQDDMKVIDRKIKKVAHDIKELDLLRVQMEHQRIILLSRLQELETESF